MRKGGGILPKPLLAAAMLALFVFALVMLYWRLELILTNPCWSDAMERLRPIAESPSRGLSATIILDGDSETGNCLSKVVFTPSPDACEDACEDYKGDEDQKRACLQKCQVEPGESKSFVVAIPAVREGILGSGKKVIDAVAKRSFYWLFDGKPMVFSLECELVDFDVPARECTPEGDSWICTPGNKKSQYNIRVVKDGERTCRIVESTAVS
ncbi:MAG: hypothetical protein JXC85_02865 [Candidatus Aenigmarchaeota archaeon]|nr:hypothetical protein [Candidatus Aenigmarchaeota archaeon]